MPTVNLENGGTIGVLGSIRVDKGKQGVTVNLLGDIATARPPGVMKTLKETSAVSAHPDDLPGKVFYSEDGKDAIPQEYVQIAPGTHTVWVMSEEDAQQTG